LTTWHLPVKFHYQQPLNLKTVVWGHPHTTTLQYPTYIGDPDVMTENKHIYWWPPTNDTTALQHDGEQVHIIDDPRQRTRLTRLKTRHDKATRSFTTRGTKPHSTGPSTTGAEQPTALLRTIGCTVRTHSPAATPDLSAPLRIIGCPRADSLAHSLAGSSRFSGQQAAHGRTHSPTASPDLHASPGNRLSTGGLTRPQPCRTFTLLRTTGCPRADSRAHSLAGSSRFSGQQAAQGGLTRPQPRRTSAQRRTTSCPGRIARSFTGSLCASSPTDYLGTQMPVAGHQQHTAPDNMARRRTDPARHRS
jgi:hypothetical protein